MYFITTNSNNDKNSLQKSIYETFRNANQKLVDNPHKFLTFVRNKIDELNAKNPRCRAAIISYYMDDLHFPLNKSIYIHAGDWTYSIMLYKVTGEVECGELICF